MAAGRLRPPMVDPLAVGAVALQAAILLALLEGVRRGNVPACVNASVSLAATLVVLLAGLVSGVGVGETAALQLVLWVALAGFLHSLGMLGPYDSIGWWDVLTHAVSAALVGALLYAAALVVLAPSSPAPPATAAVVGVTLGLTAAVGGFWELIELVARDLEDRYGVDPVLVHYGWRDTALDLVVDVAAAAVVVLLDVRAFVPLAARAPGVTRSLLAGTAGIVAVGSLLTGLWIRLDVETAS